MMQCFKDLDGKVPAEDGDRVALVVDTYNCASMIQKQSCHRPIYREHFDCIDLTRDEYMENAND